MNISAEVVLKLLEKMNALHFLFCTGLSKTQMAAWNKELLEYFDAKTEFSDEVMKKYAEGNPKEYLVIWYSKTNTSIWNYFTFIGNLPEDEERLMRSPSLTSSFEKHGINPGNIWIEIHEKSDHKVMKVELGAKIHAKNWRIS